MSEEIYDIFNILTLIMTKPNTNKPLFSIYNRSKFILNFFQYLAFGNIVMPIESLSREMQVGSKYNQGKEYFYKTKYPLISQKAFHLSYYIEQYEN
jgi:hypothetical protein